MRENRRGGRGSLNSDDACGACLQLTPPSTANVDTRADGATMTTTTGSSAVMARRESNSPSNDNQRRSDHIAGIQSRTSRQGAPTSPPNNSRWCR
uniref:Uncharacterized protein n=1 Tax=Globodera pallida TaxID=36090 RepID=A0A183CP17_GLOPA